MQPGWCFGCRRSIALAVPCSGEEPRISDGVTWAGEANTEKVSASADIDQHTKTNALRLHHAELDASGNFVLADEWLDMADEPDHQALCEREQAWFLRTIQEDIDLTQDMADALTSLRIVLAAQQSIDEGRAVDL